MSRIPLTPPEIQAGMEKIDEEAIDALHTTMLKWIEQKAAETGLPRGCIAGAAGKAMIEQGHIMLCAAAGLTASQSRNLYVETLTRLNRAFS